MTERQNDDPQDEREPEVDPEPIKDLDVDEDGGDAVRGGLLGTKSHAPV